MSIESEKDLLGLLRIGKIVGLTLQEMQNSVKPDMTTAELDDIGAAFLKKNGAQSSPQRVYGFPGATCISLNEEAAHGIPGERVIRAGDLVKIDVTAELDGYVADSSVSMVVPPASPMKRKLCACAKSALLKGLASAQAGHPINTIGRSVEKEIARHNFAVVRELCGHGVGKTIHEEPRMIPNYYIPQLSQRLTEGLVLAIEPHVSPKSTRIMESPDGWTLKTTNGCPVAAFEHTVVITRGKPIVITAV